MVKNNQSKIAFLMAHGAGADKDSDWMIGFDNKLDPHDIEVIRFNFPYMQERTKTGKKRPPDRQSKLLESFVNEIERIEDDCVLFIGGKSMGGRMASLLMVDDAISPIIKDKVKGVICLGYPFHPPGKPEKFKGAHLPEINVPLLILQGERDTFGNRQEIENYAFSDSTKIQFLADGDHSFKPRVKSGLTLDDNLYSAANLVKDFISTHY
ncbi:MAG: alpha/beta hydrolase [Gammaproteobacteria bacterium]|nr:alpha/beta hydrolase [Gammaproteobacteria bacterium]